MTQVRRDEDAWRMIGEMRNEIAQLQRVALPPELIVDGKLPENPYPDQAIEVQVAAGTIWKFRYNDDSASDFKWEYTGGSRLADNIGGAGPVAHTNATYQSLGSFLVPFPGDYFLMGNVSSFQSYGASDFVACVNRTGSRNVNHRVGRVANGAEDTGAGFGRVDGCAIGESLSLDVYCVAAGGGYGWQTADFAVEPIRVG